MGSPAKKIWFPAKTYGWGWGPPTCWQGWVVIVIYAVLTGMGVIVFRPEKLHPVYFAAYVVALTVALCFVCWLKGEKPRWRQGKNDAGDPPVSG